MPVADPGLPWLLDYPAAAVQRIVSRKRCRFGAIRAEPKPASQGPTGISLPTKTGGPDGCPVGEPPGGSTVTA